MKRGADEISADRTLEECVYIYIQHWQTKHNGKGVGIAVDDLNHNIVHPEKPTGKHSERRFKEMMRGMSSLTESDELWNNKVVFKIKARSISRSLLRSSCDSAGQILRDVVSKFQNQINAYHPAAKRIAIDRNEFTIIVEDLMAAEEFVRVARNEC